MNVQFAIQDGDGLRARGESARLAHRAVRVQGDRRAAREDRGALHGGRRRSTRRASRGEVVPPYFSVKEAVFPFIKFPGVDTILGPEMKSTGEVMGVGETFGEAFVKSQLAAGVRLPQRGQGVHQRARRRQAARWWRSRATLLELGFALVATRGTAAALAAAGLPVTAGQQGGGGPAAHRRHDQERRDRADRQHRRGQADRGRATRARSGRPRCRAASPTTRPSPGARAACVGMRHHASADAATTCRACTRGCRPLNMPFRLDDARRLRPAFAGARLLHPEIMSKIPLTVAGAELLRAELQRLKTVERPAIIQAIAEARSHGDLSENAEYDAAKERQSFIEGRIAELEGKLANAQIIDPKLLDADGRCVFGATVELEDVHARRGGHLPDRRRGRGRHQAGQDLDQLADRARADRQVRRRRGRGADAGRGARVRDRRRASTTETVALVTRDRIFARRGVRRAARCASRGRPLAPRGRRLPAASGRSLAVDDQHLADVLHRRRVESPRRSRRATRSRASRSVGHHRILISSCAFERALDLARRRRR